MSRTYEGVLRDSRIVWSREAPPRHQAFHVRVTVLDDKAGEDASRGRRMAEALRRLAETDAFGGIADPVAWQRQSRSERSLPGREDE